MISKDVFLNFKPRSKAVELPELGGSVTVREVTAHEFGEYNRQQKDSPNTATAYLISRVVIDDAGNQLFANEDIGKLEHIGFKATNSIMEAALELSGLLKTADAKADGKK